mgnify:CR=1 FL=1
MLTSLNPQRAALLIFLERLLLHVSRGVRWDSDHVVTFSDDLQAIADETVRAGALDRVQRIVDGREPVDLLG